MTEGKRLPTHMFLASLGKTMLRPGGREATNRIIESCQITKDTKVLEVAPNMGTTAIYLAKTYGCHVTGVDIHKESVEKARENVRRHGLENLVDIQHGNALDLPFAEQSFDVVINEAMLTMLNENQKRKALSEYFRVLKSGGRLATHDLLLKQNPADPVIEERLKNMRKALVVNAQPLTEEDWYNLFVDGNFTNIDAVAGKMCLLTLKGLIVDEGWEGMLAIIQNARKEKFTEDYLFHLIDTFDTNDDLYGHITFTACKE